MYFTVSSAGVFQNSHIVLITQELVSCQLPTFASIYSFVCDKIFMREYVQLVDIKAFCFLEIIVKGNMEEFFSTPLPHIQHQTIEDSTAKITDLYLNKFRKVGFTSIIFNQHFEPETAMKEAML